MPIPIPDFSGSTGGGSFGGGSGALLGGLVWPWWLINAGPHMIGGRIF